MRAALARRRRSGWLMAEAAAIVGRFKGSVRSTARRPGQLCGDGRSFGFTLSAPRLAIGRA